MNKVVSYQEAFTAYRNLGWREDHLVEWGAKGADFAKGIEEELNVAKALLSRKFNAKAKANGLDEKLANRIARVENRIFSQVEMTTIH